MNSLLSSYRREKSKEKKTTITGQGRNDIFQSVWFAYKLFDFLRDKDTETVTFEDNSEQSSLLVDDFTNQPPDNVDHISSDAEQCSSKSDEIPTSSKRTPKIAPKKFGKKRCTEDPRLTQAYKMLDSVANKPCDEIATFGEHIVSRLRKFNLRQQTILMHKINTFIFDT